MLPQEWGVGTVDAVTLLPVRALFNAPKPGVREWSLRTRVNPDFNRFGEVGSQPGEKRKTRASVEDFGCDSVSAP